MLAPRLACLLPPDGRQAIDSSSFNHSHGPRPQEYLRHGRRGCIHNAWQNYYLKFSTPSSEKAAEVYDADVYTCTVHLLSSLVPEQLRINRQPPLAEGRTAGSGLWAGTYERWS